MTFTLLPAVDVRDGMAVRLHQGRSGTETGYGDPLEAALTWQTGYPMRVSYREGRPRYLPGRSALERLNQTDGEAYGALVEAVEHAAEPRR